ncbi:MAG: rhamnosyltransferase subunit B [Isosphaeraceae bacterium]|jgi:UDP:flavonoid glycosyltransferase YjiC (YdhE family)|nr:MAG: rhamnosyltransferase subunit B [Isosphaeraceae bacterium]
MRVLLVPIGSHGDVHPFIGLGRKLAERGHEVVVVTNEHFAGMVEAAGLRFEPFGTEAQFREAIGDPGLWRPLEGLRHVMGFVARATPELRARIESLIVPGQTVAAAPATALAARNLEDAGRLALVSIALQPAILRSAIDPPLLPGLRFVRWLPVWARRRFYDFADARLIDPLLAPAVNADRAALGLPPIRRVMQWWHSPRRILALFPDWFAPAPPDWPAHLICAGFPLFDEGRDGASRLDPDLEQFLDEGQPPLVFTAGSANIHAHAFFAAAAEACRMLGRRGLLLARLGDQIPRSLPPGVRHVAYAPFSRLLPRAAALVHHGGIGTTAQALAARLPQLVIPLAHDQPDNAARLERLGVGRTLTPERATAAAMARVLRRLLEDPALPARAAALADQIEPAQTLDRACCVIEEALEPGVVRASLV